MRVKLLWGWVCVSVVLVGCAGGPEARGPSPTRTAVTSQGDEEEMSPQAKALMERIRQQEERLKGSEGARVEPVALGPETRDSGEAVTVSSSTSVEAVEVCPSTVEAAPAPVPAEKRQPTIEGLIAYLESQQPLSEKQRRQLAVLKALEAGGDSETVLKAVADGSADSTFKELVTLTSDYQAGDPDKTMTALRHLEDQLRERSSVSIHSPTFCSKVVGFGNYDAVRTPVFLRGAPALIYFEVADFVCRKSKGEQFEYHLACQLTLLDTTGHSVGKVFNSDRAFHSKSQLRDCHWPITFVLPKTVQPGEYVLKITVTDRLKNQVAEERASLTLR